MSDYIPQELLHEILIKLPVESLVRFTSVNKSWYSLITDPIFIINHLNYSNLDQDKRPLLLRFYDRVEKEENYTIRCDNETFSEEFTRVEFPFKSPLGYFRIVGICNGLVCLSDDLFGDTERVIVWNPSIRKSVDLEMPVRPKYPHMFVLGFGVCPVMNDYKVVRVVYVKDVNDPSFNFTVPPEVQVYSLSTGYWRDVNAGAPSCYMVEYTWSQVFVFGSVHWVAFRKLGDSGSRNLIVSFHMGDEVFREVVLPDSLANDIVYDMSVSVFGDSLAALKYSKETGQESCCVWVMREYGVAESWTKLYTISVPGLTRTICFRKDGEVILSLSNNELVSYDPVTGKIKNLGIFGNMRSFYVGTYVESLVLLKGQSSLVEGISNLFSDFATENAVIAEQ
ncbi:F-box protein CPR30 [Heracleum sosnowskyi]|uniref:F-box protein CPR30 n=1 Tax=Heracleum sosnowskyi TaxID=360622 RepID=A0AAD8J220_9APIA|nr:F-box protein CPR30 [Heracleum sosnowskyi]